MSYILPLGISVETTPNPQLNISMMQGEQRSFLFTVVDSQNQPVDISSDNLLFTCFTDDGITQSQVFQLNNSAGIVATGNTIVVTIPSSDSASTGVYSYSLFDSTSLLVLSHGEFEISPTLT